MRPVAAASGWSGGGDQPVRMRADRRRRDLGVARRAAHDRDVDRVALEVGDVAAAVGFAQLDLDVGRNALQASRRAAARNTWPSRPRRA